MHQLRSRGEFMGRLPARPSTRRPRLFCLSATAFLRPRLAGDHSSFLSAPKPPSPFITPAVVRKHSCIIPRVLKSHADAVNGIMRGLN